MKAWILQKPAKSLDEWQLPHGADALGKPPILQNLRIFLTPAWEAGASSHCRTFLELSGSQGW